MRKYLQILFILLIVSSSLRAYDYPNYDWSGDLDENSFPIFDDAASADHLKNKSDLIIKLYGDNETSWAKFWQIMENSKSASDWICGLDRVWTIDELKATIRVNGSSLTDEEKKTLVDAADKDIAELVRLSDDNFNRNCSLLHDELQKSSRKNLDCALPSQRVTHEFKKIFHHDSTTCWQFSGGLWKALVKGADFSNSCNASLVYSDVVRIAQIAGGEHNAAYWSTPDEAVRLELVGRITASISVPNHIEYLTRISCPKEKHPWKCEAIVEAVKEIMCKQLSLNTVRKLEELVRGQINTCPFSNLNDVDIAMEILEELTDIVDILSKNKLDIQPRAVSVTNSALETYLDIMDNAIGAPSQDMWSKLSQQETHNRLSRILDNNEKYIWSMSRLFYSSDGHGDSSELTKAAMELQISKINSGHASDKVEFQFGEANIETRVDANEIQGDLNVFAIHYKSWAELIQKQGLQLDNSTAARKQFVGKGGIISLSAHVKNDKKSVPVSYKMNIDPSTKSRKNGERRSYCLSCEYLNLETGEWENTGCNVSTVTDVGVTCDCNHTTNFAAFMSPVDIEMDMTPTQKQVKQIISYVGSAISVLALAACLVVFNVVKPAIRNDRLKAHMSLAFALLIVHVVQLAADLVVYIDSLCLISTVITHYFLLAAFFWMLIEGIFLYLYVVQVFVHSSIEYLRWVYVLGWSIPGLIVLISAAVGIPNDTYLDLINRTTGCSEDEALYPPLPAHKYKSCWISAKTNMAWSFIAPALIIIIVNAIILAKVFQVLMRVSRKNRSTHRPYQLSSSSSSGHTNKAYKRKDDEREESSSTSSPNRNGIDIETGYGATALANGESPLAEKALLKNKTGSPESGPSTQRYMHNRAQPSKTSPLRDSSSKDFVGEVKTALKGALVLLPILGIPWICGLFVGNSYYLMILFIVINSTQGLFIFIVYCLMNGDVMRALRRHVKVAKLRSHTGRSRIGSASSLKSVNSRFTISWRTKSTSNRTDK